jgi:DNA-binding transcriptional MerR regulator/methylmalonyl-CoA mutase cobalamin-binding subunit
MATPAKRDSTAELYPIRTVSSLTGINAITLRAWERRYGLIKPVRTDGGHRVYTREDIDRLHRILALVGDGVAISQVRQALSAAPAGRKADSGPWAGYRARMTAAIAQFDEQRLEDVYEEMLSLHPSARVTQEALLPLLQELGKRWLGTRGGIAEEHFFAVFLRNKLGARFHHRSRAAAGPRLLVACLPGEHHEVGLLLFALAAHEQGYRPVLLGADMPLDEVGYAAQRALADAVVLSGSIDPAPGVLEQALSSLVRDAGVPVLVGGSTSVRRRDTVVAAGAMPLGSDIPAGLARVAAVLKPPARGTRLARSPR